MWVSVLPLIFMLSYLSTAEDSCPDIKVVGVGESDKLTILRGCPGLQGPAGNKGEPGLNGQKGQFGERGIPGSPGQKGEKGERSEPGPLYVARNCKEIQNHGEVLSDWYTIYPDGTQPLKVLCDMHTDGGGWIVFQRRWDGSVSFFRDWHAYKEGFGSRLNEFWLGNDNLHKITSLGTWELRVDLQDFQNTKQHATYKSFKVLGEDEKYKLVLGDFKSGNAESQLPTNWTDWIAIPVFFVLLCIIYLCYSDLCWQLLTSISVPYWLHRLVKSASFRTSHNNESHPEDHACDQML